MQARAEAEKKTAQGKAKEAEVIRESTHKRIQEAQALLRFPKLGGKNEIQNMMLCWKENRVLREQASAAGGGGGEGEVEQRKSLAEKSADEVHTCCISTRGFVSMR